MISREITDYKLPGEWWIRTHFPKLFVYDSNGRRNIPIGRRNEITFILEKNEVARGRPIL